MSSARSIVRRTVTSMLIRLGPESSFVITLLNRECRKHGAELSNAETYLCLRKGRQEMRLAPKHFVYAPVISERFDIYFNDLLPVQINGFQVVDFSSPGILQTYKDSGLQFQMASFPEELSAIDDYFHWYTPESGDTVFDIGAHCGVSSFHFSKLVGESGRVVAFEPDPVNHSLLVKNIERHGLSNVEVHQVAIAGACGTAEFSAEESIGSCLMKHSTRSSVGKVVQVETVTLERAFHEWGPPKFCKIDIEGSEIEVIASSIEFLKAQGRNCQFALDTNHLIDGELTADRIETLFRKAGFEAESSVIGFKSTWARSAHAS